MSHDVFIADLKTKSSQRVEQIWSEAKDKVDELRQQKASELERRQQEVLRLFESEAEKVAGPILHDAQRKALSIEDDAMRGLSERFYELAVDMLGLVRQKDYEAFFSDMVSEIPSVHWQMVRVNPADKELARTMFPGAKIEADESVIGGFEVSADEGRYRVVSLLEKRLEKGWPMTLPGLLKEITDEIDAKSPA